MWASLSNVLDGALRLTPVCPACVRGIPIPSWKTRRGGGGSQTRRTPSTRMPMGATGPRAARGCLPLTWGREVCLLPRCRKERDHEDFRFGSSRPSSLPRRWRDGGAGAVSAVTPGGLGPPGAPVAGARPAQSADARALRPRASPISRPPCERPPARQAPRAIPSGSRSG